MSCNICDNEGIHQCVKCGTQYCSSVCQQIDWTHNDHKTMCALIEGQKRGREDPYKELFDIINTKGCKELEEYHDRNMGTRYGQLFDEDIIHLKSPLIYVIWFSRTSSPCMIKFMIKKIKGNPFYRALDGDVVDENGDNALMLYIHDHENLDYDIVYGLAEIVNDLSILNQKRKSALDIAINKEEYDVVQFLVSQGAKTRNIEIYEENPGTQAAIGRGLLLLDTSEYIVDEYFMKIYDIGDDLDFNDHKGVNFIFYLAKGFKDVYEQDKNGAVNVLIDYFEYLQIEQLNRIDDEGNPYYMQIVYQLYNKPAWVVTPIFSNLIKGGADPSIKNGDDVDLMQILRNLDKEDGYEVSEMLNFLQRIAPGRLYEIINAGDYGAFVTFNNYFNSSYLKITKKNEPSPFVLAVKHNRKRMIVIMANRFINVSNHTSTIDADGNTALMSYIKHTDVADINIRIIEALKKIVNSNDNLYNKNSDGEEAMDIAIGNNQSKTVQFLAFDGYDIYTYYNADIVSKRDIGRGLLFRRSGDLILSGFESFMKRYKLVNLDFVNYKNISALDKLMVSFLYTPKEEMYNAISQLKSVIKYISEEHLNRIVDNKLTYMLIIKKMSVSNLTTGGILKNLLDSGLNPELKNKNGNDFFEYVNNSYTYDDKKKIMKVLMRHPNVQRFQAKRLYVIMSEGTAKDFQEFVSENKDFDYNIVFPNGLDELDNVTPLMVAILLKRHSFYRWLIPKLSQEEYTDFDSLFNKRNVNGDTALHLAVKNENQYAVRILLEYAADIDIRNNEGQTADMLGELNPLLFWGELKFRGYIYSSLEKGKTDLVLNMSNYNDYKFYFTNGLTPLMMLVKYNASISDIKHVAHSLDVYQINMLSKNKRNESAFQFALTKVLFKKYYVLNNYEKEVFIELLERGSYTHYKFGSLNLTLEEFVRSQIHQKKAADELLAFIHLHTTRVTMGPDEYKLNIMLKHGDIRTVLTLTRYNNRLSRYERQDPEKFWKGIFHEYYPQYVDIIDEVRNWKSLTLWITWAEKRIIKSIVNMHKDDFEYDYTEWLVTTKEDGKQYSIVHFAKNMGFPKGRILHLGKLREGTIIQKAIHDRIIGDWANLVKRDFESTIVVESVAGNAYPRVAAINLYNIVEMITNGQLSWMKTTYPKKNIKEDQMIYIGEEI